MHFCVIFSYLLAKCRRLFVNCFAPSTVLQIHLPVVCILTVICSQAARQASCASSNSLAAYPFDTFSHLSPRLLLALIAFPSSSSLGCLLVASFIVPCLIASYSRAQHANLVQPTTFDALLSSRFYAQQFYRFMNYAPCVCVRACQRANWQRGAYIMRQMMSHPLRKLSPFMASQ